MRTLPGILACGLAVVSCDASTAPRSSLDYEFGRVTALIDERAWHSSYFPDSVVAFYDTLTARLQISGQEVRPSGIWPTLLIVIPADATVGAYPLTADGAGRVAIWTPTLGAAYASSGAPGDSVWVEELDPATRTVRGTFRFLGAPIFNQRSVYVVGRFEGRYLPTGGL